MARIGSALFNADHAQLGAELARAEEAGVDFFHLDVFDGYFVRDQAFPARTIQTLRQLTMLPFEVHLAAEKPERFLPALKEAGVDLVFLPAESTPLLYETIYTVRELGMDAGLCLALGTSLEILRPVLPMLDAVLLLGRVTGEGQRGRDFNDLILNRIREVKAAAHAAGVEIDLQAAGGLEIESCIKAVEAGATSLPLGKSFHREKDQRAFLAHLRGKLPHSSISAPPEPALALTDSSTRANILVASRSFGKNCPDVLEKLKAAGCHFLPGFDSPPGEQELAARIGEVDVLVSGTEPVTARVLDAAPKLKVIAKHGVGVDNIDLAHAAAKKIPVAVAGPAMVDAVADLTFGLLLASARQICQGNASLKAGKWERFVGPELQGKALGIVGLGQIGKAVARRAVGFGMTILAYDAFPDFAFAQSWGVQMVPLDSLLAHADFISVHAPLTSESRKMFGRDQFQMMKPGAHFISMARGELVDEEALFEVLQTRRIAAAAADVFSKEPPGDHSFFKLSNFIGMPHCAGQTPEALRRMGEITGENILRVLRGQKPLYQA